MPLKIDQTHTHRDYGFTFRGKCKYFEFTESFWFLFSLVFFRIFFLHINKLLEELPLCSTPTATRQQFPSEMLKRLEQTENSNQSHRKLNENFTSGMTGDRCRFLEFARTSRGKHEARVNEHCLHKLADDFY